MNKSIQHVEPSLPGLAVDDTLIPSEDGSEVYVFDANGRQLETLDGLTGALRYSFGYDSAGRLISVTDVGSGNITTIQHDALGNPTAIIAPGGQRTTLTVDANGYLASVTDPLGHTTQMTTTADGLLTSFTMPNGALHQFSYDAQGLLTQGPGSGWHQHQPGARGRHRRLYRDASPPRSATPPPMWWRSSPMAAAGRPASTRAARTR